MSETLMVSITIFTLATFIGIEVISKVPPLLHTPLMSGSNAISGITVVGSIIAAGEGHAGLSVILGMVAVIFATVNVVGGFLVTDRMLKMFKKDTHEKKPQ
jgi:NAD(P) transhydrogenase subunit alpha